MYTISHLTIVAKKDCDAAYDVLTSRTISIPRE